MQRISVTDYYRRFGREIRRIAEREGTHYISIEERFPDLFDEHLRSSAISKLLSGNQRAYLHQAHGMCLILGTTLDAVLESPQNPLIPAQDRDKAALDALIEELGTKESLRRLLRSV